MKRLCLPLALVCLAGAGYAQLLPDQKLLDFQQLAALYAKQYAPYEWKRDALHVDLLQLAPWLAKVRETKSDIEFYEVCAQYVASLNDAHSEFFLPSDFQADLLFEVDLYDGKALVDFIDPSIARQVSFQIGDELVSVDGKVVADWIKEFGKFNSFANQRSTDRNSASLITFRPQVIYPRAMEIGENAAVIIRRKSTGSLQTYMMPWDKFGLPITVIGPVPSPKLNGATNSSPKPEPKKEGEDSTPSYLKPLMSLRNQRLPEQKNIRGFGEITPVFQPSLPSNFVRRLGRNTDFFYSGTFSSGGKRIGLIRIPDFLDSSSADLEPFALQQFQTEVTFMQNNTDGLVLDIMRNPGGDGCYAESLLLRLIPYRFRGMGQEVRVTRDWVLAFSEAIDQASFFGIDPVTLDQLKAILGQLQNAYKQNHVRTDVFPQCATYFERDPTVDRNGNVIAYSKPIMLLTDEFSVSAAEIFAALFQDSKRGPILGFRTAGAGGSIPVNPATTGFYSESSAYATQAMLVRNEQILTQEFPTTSYIENVGVRPDIPVDYMTEANLTNRGKPFVDAFTAAMLELIK
jgi:C-terminal processing protease CtpA/Prc